MSEINELIPRRSNGKEVQPQIPAIDDSLDFIEVPMNRWGVTTGKRDNPVLATRGISGCTGLAIYDPKSKSAGFVHIRAAKFEEGGWQALDKDILSPYLVMQRYGAPASYGERHTLKAYVVQNDIETDTKHVVTRLRTLGFNESNIHVVSGEYAVALDARNGKLKRLVNLIRRPFVSEDDKISFSTKSLLGDAQKTVDKRSLG